MAERKRTDAFSEEITEKNAGANAGRRGTAGEAEESLLSVSRQMDPEAGFHLLSTF